MIEGYKARVRFVRVTLLILTLLLSALFLFPYVFLALSSFKPAQEVITIPPTFFPKTFSIENYQEMYNYINVEKSLLNSFVSAFGSTAIAVLLGALSAFALVRANSKLSAILLAMVFFLKMIPLSAIAVPIYRIITSVGLYDTRIALVIVLAATNMPLVIWIMIGFFQSVPVSLDEAACVDGASSLATFFRVILPVSVPGIATAGILTLFLSWNDFLLSLMLTSTNAKTFTVSPFGVSNQPWANDGSFLPVQFPHHYLGHICPEIYYTGAYRRLLERVILEKQAAQRYLCRLGMRSTKNGLYTANHHG